MIRRLNPTRIELKKSDLEQFEQRVRDIESSNAASINEKEGNIDLARQPSLPLNLDERKAAIRRRIGYEPETVPSDGATNIHF
eukprot:gene11141-12313_t